MANILGEAWVEIRAPLARLGRDLSNAQRLVDRSSAAMSTRMGRVGAAMSSLGTKMTLGLTLPIIGYMGVAVKAAAEEEASIVNLNEALKANNSYTEESAKALSAYADELMNLTVYDDEAIRAAMAYGVALKGNATNIKQVTVAAIGLAHMFGIQLNEGMAIAARGSEGIAVRLMRLGIKLKKGATDAQIWAAVSGKGSKGFAAAMAYAANTAEGQMLQLRNAMQEVNRSIGQDLIPNLKHLVGSLKTIANVMEKMPSGWKLWGLAALAAIGPASLAAGNLLQYLNAIKLAQIATAAGGLATGAAAAGGIGVTVLAISATAAGVIAGAFIGMNAAKAGMEAARTGGPRPLNPLSIPGFYIEKWVNAFWNRWAQTSPGKVPSGYRRGDIRAQETVRYSRLSPQYQPMTAEQGKEVIQHLKDINTKTGRYQ